MSSKCLNPNCSNRRVPYSSYCCTKCEPIYLREGKPVYDDNPIESVYLQPTQPRRAGTRKGWCEPVPIPWPANRVPAEIKDLLELHESHKDLRLPREIVAMVVKDSMGHLEAYNKIPETAPSGLMDSTKQTYVIPLGTVVMIADRTMKLSEHTTKRENKFARECIILNSDAQPKMTLTYKGEHQ